MEKGKLVPDAPGYKPRGKVSPDSFVNVGMTVKGSDQPAPNHHYETTTLGWQPTCDHDHEPVSAVVFDPFAGSGTTLQVARALGRNGVGLDLSLEYLQLARKRLSLDALDAWTSGGKKDGANVTDLPMFKEED